MRLHRLELTAFGPFPRTESVDFDALGADGLFLLCGHTGAGKTTLLDAISFALFGVVPGARGEVKRLRCDQADPATPTRVALELTVGSHRMRIERFPEYERPKKRGEGTTKQPAKASLTWVGDPPGWHNGDPVTRIDEVARTVQRLLGMTADQFFQVVLLPQGEFATFLRADTAERERLLDKLFGTHRFEAVQDWFVEHRRQRRAELDLARADFREWVARFAQAAGQEPPETGILEWAKQTTQRAIEDYELAAKQAAAAFQASKQAEATLAERRDLRDRVQLVATHTAKLEQLRARADELQRARDELAQARRAESVRAAHREWQRAQDELAKALRAEAAAAEGVDEADADKPAAQLRARAGALREQAGQLAGAIEEASRQRERQQRLDRVTEQAQDAERRIADVDAELHGLPARLEGLRGQLAAAQAAATKLEHARTVHQELSEALALAQRLPELQRALEQAEERLREAIDTHQNAREERQRLYDRRLAGMAAELAGQLSAGDPCPVCGSTEHPAPTRAGEGAVSEDAVRAAVEAEDDAHRLRSEAEQAKHEAQAAVAELRARLRGRTAETLQHEVAEAERELAGLEKAAARAEELEAAVAGTQERIDQLTTARAGAEQARAAAQAEARSLREAIAEAERRLADARGEFPSVEQRRLSLLDRAKACEVLADARTTVASCQARVAEQRATVAEAARSAGFPSVDAALAAAREPEVIARLDAEVTDAEVQERSARDILADPKLAGIEPDMQVDVAGAKAEAEQARKAADAALVTEQSAKDRVEQLEELGERLQERSARLAPLEAEFAELDALTDVLNGRGQNTKRMSLRSYVLAARLEEVAVAATARLRVMSQGRYAFVHSDAAGARGTRGGLGLDVLDDYSGTVRSTKTLSGGESFLASLALALGLADVVSAEAGGVQLDTLFIDEGFGTLDAETLDVVMDTLDGLRAGGRVVGLVSHVEEMRQRIPTKLFVRKGRTGSTLHMQV
ncbi:AAA family ATPase [Thermocrispum agreste]|nr:SMC family ATPase [Thermocrispum agreste]